VLAAELTAEVEHALKGSLLAIVSLTTGSCQHQTSKMAGRRALICTPGERRLR
jgi:hypothetical protein